MNISEENWAAREWCHFFNRLLVSSKTTFVQLSFFRGEVCLSQCLLCFGHLAEVLLWTGNECYFLLFFYLFAGEWHTNNTKQCSCIVGDHPEMRHSEQENKAVYNFRRNKSGRRILSERKWYSFYIKFPALHTWHMGEYDSSHILTIVITFWKAFHNLFTDTNFLCCLPGAIFHSTWEAGPQVLQVGSGSGINSGFGKMGWMDQRCITLAFCVEVGMTYSLLSAGSISDGLGMQALKNFLLLF